jgi:HTH-type transcriptional regulator, glycine betaine synthesis regulator
MSALRARNRSLKEPKVPSPNGGLSALEAEAVGLFVELGRMMGQPRSVAEVYGLLFISTGPMTIEDLVEQLGTSRAAADRALRFLRKSGALRIVYVPGDRRMHFEAVAELRHLVSGFVRDQILPQLANSGNRIDRLAAVVHKLPGEQRAKLSDRVARLEIWSKKSRDLVPIVARMLED